MRSKKEKLFNSITCLGIIFIFFTGLIAIIASGGGDDNGNTDETYDISGYVQKGPFISGSSIIIYELDSDLNQTGTSFQTQTVDDFGSFILPDKVSSRYVEIISNGYYFNEVEGQLSSSPLTLSAISDVTAGEDIHVNILTCLASKRIRYLVLNEDKSFQAARSQAESEILAIFDIDETEILNFDRMDISEEGNSNAILLAVSVILQANNTVAELSELVSKINLDIEKDGTLDNSSYREEITNNSMALSWEAIRTNLINRYASIGLSITVPDFEAYVYGGNYLFSSGQILFTSAFTETVTAGDLNIDGDLDLVVGSSIGFVSVYLNNGDGTFALPATYNSGSEYTKNVAIGDLDDDGTPDLVIINPYSVSVLLNKGDGTFATAVDYDVEADWDHMFGVSSLDSATIGDFDGDGYLDMAVTSNMPDNIFVFLNKGDGTFANEVSYSAHIYPHDIVSGDLNGDGDLDLAVTESNFSLDPSESSVSVFLNNGNGTFAAEVNYTAGESPYYIALGDLDGDGDPDLVAADNNSEDGFYDASVLLNNGEGTFTTAAAYSAGNMHKSMVMGDLDGDGDLDMARTKVDGISVFLNNGDGTFATALNILLTESGFYDDATLGDFDGDGDLDMAAVGSDSVSVFLNNSNN